MFAGGAAVERPDLVAGSSRCAARLPVAGPGRTAADATVRSEALRLHQAHRRRRGCPRPGAAAHLVAAARAPCRLDRDRREIGVDYWQLQHARGRLLRASRLLAAAPRGVRGPLLLAFQRNACSVDQNAAGGIADVHGHAELRARRGHRRAARSGAGLGAGAGGADRGGDRPGERLSGRTLARDGRARACSGSPCRRSTAGPGWGISPTWWRSRRSPGPRRSVALSYGAHSNLCVNQIRLNGTEAQKRAVPAGAGLRRACRGARHVGGGCGLGRGVDEAPGAEAERPLRAERHEILDHQRARRGHPGGLCQDRPGGRGQGHHRLPDREDHGGLLDQPAFRQARHARLEHRRADLRGLRGAVRERARARRARASTC